MLLIFAIFVVPIILLATGLLPLHLRYALAIPVTILIAHSVYREKWSLKKLGIRLDNFKESVLPYTIFTVVVVIGILILAKLFDRHAVLGWFNQPHFQFFFLLTSFFQEFAYRGYLVPKLEAMTDSVFAQVLVNAILFSALHFFFPQPILVLSVTFVLGVALTLLYKRYRNLLLVSLSHSVINFLGVLFCFASLNTSC